MSETFEAMLTGGHPNSLGRTLEVVDAVLADQAKLRDLMDTWFSTDEIVRLRVANAVKRVTIEHPDWTMDHMDRLQRDVAAIDQPSTQWTLALLFDLTRDRLGDDQRERAVDIMKGNLAGHDDWIVLGNSMKVLSAWATDDATLADWLVPHLERLSGDPRKSVASRAARLLPAMRRLAERG